MSRQRVLPSQQQQQPQQQPLCNNKDAPHLSGRPTLNSRRPSQQSSHSTTGPSHHPPQDQIPPPSGQHYQTTGGAPASPPRSLRGQQQQQQHQRPRQPPPPQGSSSGGRPAQSRRQNSIPRDPFLGVTEDEILKTYSVLTLQPEHWEDTSKEPHASGDAPLSSPGDSRAKSVVTSNLANLADEPDPLGLYRGSVLSTVGELSADVRAAILLQSKAFDPKTFLATIHPSATPDDLRRGRDRLRDSIESRSGAMQRLVEDNFDKFISVKAATATVYDELKQGPLSEEGDYSVADLKESLRLAQNRADGVWNPILEARLKADRLGSTLSIFERSKFFFTLPGALKDSIAAGKLDQALVSYKKGKYLLDSRPGALLGLPPGTVMTEAQREKHGRVYEKVWNQVEKTMSDLKSSLIARLRDPREGLEEVEKTVEVLLELDPTTDPVWIYFDTQHHHIMQVLRNSHKHAVSKYQAVIDKTSPDSLNETTRAVDLEKSLTALEVSTAESVVAEQAAGAEAWKTLLAMVHSLSDILLQTLPNFWKVARGYMDGKYQKKESSRDHAHKKAATATKRSPSQVKVMTNDIINLYISLLSQFFRLSSSTASPIVNAGKNGDSASVDLPSFMPAHASAITSGHWLLRVVGEIYDTINEVGSLANLPNDCRTSLKEFLNSARWKFVDSTCLSWVRDAKIFFRLENWVLDPEDFTKTVYIRRVAGYQRTVARLAYRASGGNEERAMGLFASSPGNALSLMRRAGRDEPIPADFSRRIHSAYLDALYAFLDGLVHVAFSDPMPLAIETTGTAKPGKTNLITSPDPPHREQVDVQNRDVRILLTVSNLSHFKNDMMPHVAEQLQTALKVDMTSDSKTLNDVVGQLDKILFDDYIKGKSVLLGRTIEKGILGDGIDWYNAPKPTEVHPYIYDALLSLVLVHAQVTAIAPSLVLRTIVALVEEVAKHALAQFSKVKAFGTGGMLQATLEMEFLHQTLNVHVSSNADATLQEIYKIISQAYSPPSGGGDGSNSNELQRELEQLKLTLTQARRATALQFLCFREKRQAQPPREQTPPTAPRR